MLDTLADELGIDLGFPTVAAALAELNGLGSWDGAPASAPSVAAVSGTHSAAGEAVLAGWRMLLDDGRLQDGEPHLAGTARAPVVRLSPATANAIGAADGDTVTVSTARGAITLPLTITEMPDHVVWLPLNSPGSAVHRQLGVTPGAVVKIGVSTTMTGFGHDTWWLILAKALLVFVFLVLTVLVAILAERKILGRMQLRWGPNRVGPRGYLQSLADGIKLALKEPITPFGVEKPIFLLAPAISTIPAITAFAFIPFGPQVSVFGHWTPLQVTDLPVAVLFILALSSIGVYGIVLAGWSSGSTYPLLGGVRSTAQVISYEVAMGLSFATVFLYAGTMSTSQIVSAQDRVWYLFLLLPSFTTYLVSMVGETNRAPFDLPEAEGELVAGFHTEYSSLSFAMFYLAEYINMTTVSALAATLFMGGWHAPWPLNMWAGANSGWWPVLWFTAKVWVFLFMYFWLRATLPRLRYDQFMALGWKLLIPVSLVWALIAAAIRTLRDQGYPHWTTVLVVSSIVVTAVLLYLLQRPFNNRQIRKRRRRNDPTEAQSVQAASREPAFPTPPMPGKPLAPATKEAAAWPKFLSSPLPGSASPSARCSNVPSPRAIRRTPGRSSRATTAATSSTATPTDWRSASAVSCARGRVPPTRSTSRAPTTPTRRGFRPVSATAASTRSTTCAASDAGCASRHARPAR